MTDSLQPRFVVDVMLGRLARWLRLLGFDTAYDRRWLDSDLSRISVREDRLLLSRKRSLLERSIVRRGLLVDADDLEQQLRIVRDACGLVIRPEHLFQRCLLCNLPTKPVSKDRARGRVPPFVLRHHETFRHCSACQRFYWPGSHHHLAREYLEQLEG